MIQNRSSAWKWKRILRRQQISGLSAAAFCCRARVPQGSFYFWRKKLQGEQCRTGVGRRPGRTPTFVEVRVAGESPDGPRTSGIELCLPGRRRVRVRPGFDRRTLLELLAALESCPPGTAAREGGA